MAQLLSYYDDYLRALQRQGALRYLTHVETYDAREVVIGGRALVNYASNDYLGLSHHEVVRQGAQRWLQRYGTGMNGSRLLGASLTAVAQLEARMAAAKEMPRAIIFGNGFSCNGSVLASVLDKSLLPFDAMVYMDRFNHASLYHGVRTAGARMRRYRHLDYDHLASLLERDREKNLCRFIVSDTLFSMDGDCCDVAVLQSLAAEHDALLLLDDAHAFGVLGENGHGLARAMPNGIITATFGKAYGCYGAVCFCNDTIAQLLLQKAGGLIYSTALPPPVLGAIETVFDNMNQWNYLRQSVMAHRQRLTQFLGDQLNCPRHDTPIVPIIVGSNERALAASAFLYEHGFFVPAVRPPTVPPHTARLRLSLSAAHRSDDIDRVASLLLSWKEKPS